MKGISTQLKEKERKVIKCVPILIPGVENNAVTNCVCEGENLT